MMQRLILPAVVGACILAATPPAGGQSERAPFSAVVERHFGDWAGQRYGKLTAARVSRLLDDPRIKGEQAAALAAIWRYQSYHHGGDGKRNYPAVTLRLLQEHRFMKDHHFESTYERASTRIDAPRQLFVHRLPSLEGLQQGVLADCYFLSSLAGLVHRDPEKVRDMIRPRRDGSYEVTFPDGERFHVPRLTDGILAISSSSGANGLWPDVLEEAYGMHRVREGRRGYPFDVINFSPAAYPIHVFTGHKTRHIWLDLHPDRRMSAARAKLLERRLRPILRRSSYRLTTAYVAPGKHPPGMETDHVYAVLGLDAEHNIVTVRNPYGQYFRPRREPHGLRNGFLTHGGIFYVPLGDFVRIFNGVTYETGRPLR
jgi:hypothetical protein